MNKIKMWLTTIRCSSILCGGTSLVYYAQSPSCCLEDTRSNEVPRQTTLLSITYDCSVHIIQGVMYYPGDVSAHAR